VILPGATVGVLGGGQLGRMFALRARTMGYRVVVLDPDPQSPAAAVADQQIRTGYDDPGGLAELARLCAAVTTEFENVPARALERLASMCTVSPSGKAVATAQDRIAEKNFFKSRNFETTRYRPVRDPEELEAALRYVAMPALLKTSRLGYDGKGQIQVANAAEAREAFSRLGSVPCILEEVVELECELSVMVARGRNGERVAFPVAENRHRDGILETSVVPARIPEKLATQARDLATKLVQALEYVGVLGIELFVTRKGALLVNEMAPRPHNSGHYTLDACSVDQFELQLRTLCELPLVPPWLLSPVAMINLLGDLWSEGEPRWEEILRRPGVRLHLYGKAEPRPGRKMGHLNCLASTADEALALAHDSRAALRLNPAMRS
jgi:5-(carboxyamino)imidazole ribonucleotide synthase